MSQVTFKKKELSNGQMGISLLQSDVQVGNYTTGLAKNKESVILVTNESVVAYHVSDDDYPILTDSQQAALLAEQMLKAAGVKVSIVGICKLQFKSSHYELTVGSSLISRVYMYDLPDQYMSAATTRLGHRYWVEPGDAFNLGGGGAYSYDLTDEQLSHIVHLSMSLITAI
jgi:hypothetical protein